MSTDTQLAETPTTGDAPAALKGRRITAMAVIGLVLIALALVVRTILAPALVRLPSSFGDSVTLEGTYTGVNLVALNVGRNDKLLATDAPFTATQAVNSVRSTGDTTVVDVSITPVVDGWIQPATTHRYAIDRDTFSSTTSSDADIVASQGLVFTAPPHPRPDNGYDFWNQAISQAVPAKYSGTATVSGRDGYVYRVEATGDVTDPAQLGLPVTISKESLIGLAPEFIKVMDPEDVQRLLPAFAAMPDTITPKYTATGTMEITADKLVGAPLATSLDQEISASIDVGGETLSAAFSHYVARTSADSERRAADTARRYARAISALQVYLPLALALLGALALAWAGSRAAAASSAAPVRPTKRGTE